MTLFAIDHVAFTVADIDATCAFYDRLFGAAIEMDHAPDGRSLVRKLRVGHAMLSIHQAGNGIDLVAARPTVGAIDICFEWGAPIADAVALLVLHDVAIVDGPSPRVLADMRKARSVYFHDPDGNLIELMAAD